MACCDSSKGYLVWAEADLRQPAGAKTPVRTRQAIRTIEEMFRTDGLL